MTEKDRFVFLEHTADAYIAAYGSTLNEAFENAGLALFETMTDLSEIEPRKEDTITAEATDIYELLYNWLEALLVRFDTQQMLYSRIKIIELTGKDKDFRLSAKAHGEPFDPQKHAQKVGVKAVTYHRMEIIRKPGNVTVKFILDL